MQKDNVRNQRENVVLTIANTQSRLGIPAEADPVSPFHIQYNAVSRLLFIFSVCEHAILLNFLS